MPEFSCTVDEDIPDAPRLDRYIAEYRKLLSRSQIKARSLKAKINGKAVKISRLVQKGDYLELFWNEAAPLYLLPENIALSVIYEDDNAVVINKPQGMVVHPGAGNRQGTLANALLYRKLERSGMAEPFDAGECAGERPGIVHRLDKETSGCIIAAYNEETHAFLAEQFKSRTTKKTYAAIVAGIPTEKTGRIETFIARDSRDRKRFTISNRGKMALTFYRVIKTWQAHSLLLLRPKTGRTHQLRVHLRHIGHPVTGDSVYGSKDNAFPGATLMLHAKRLTITLPGEAAPRTFKAPLPERFTAMIQRLNSNEEVKKMRNRE